MLNQLSRLTTTGTGGIDIQYSYSATQNNGKIMQTQDNITGEQISYAYDALLRLASAATTANPSVPQWGQSYTYDGFGNLTDQTLTQGSGPDVHVTVNPATNQLTNGDTYDANGNDTSLGSYDNENHMVTAGSAKYGNAPDGTRVWKAPDNTASHEEFYFWTPGGQRLGIYKSTNPGTNAFTKASTNVYFGGRLIQAQGTTMITDPLGSNVGTGKRYYPYGAEKPSATTNNIEKFTGYYRDTETGLDYADQRYHQPGMGRFTSPDPSATSARLSDPGSWNRYSYVGGDPISRMDPSGLCSEYMGQLSDDDDEGLGDLLYSGPCQFDPVSGAVITSQVEEVAVFGTADPAPTYASENDTSITQDDGDDDDDSLTQQQQQSSSSAAPASAPNTGGPGKGGCFARGLLVGAGGALLVAGGAVAAVTLGAPAAVVTGVLLVGGAIGGASTIYSAGSNIANGNYAAAAYDVGSLTGGVVVGGLVGGPVGDSINPPATRGWSLSNDLGNAYNSALGSVGGWLGTGPDAAAAGGATAAGGSGLARFLRGRCQ